MLDDEDIQREVKSGGSWEHEDLAQVRVKTFRGHSDQVKSAEFFFADRRILSAGYDCCIRIWETGSGSLRETLRDHHTRINGARLSNDQISFVSSGWDKRIVVWDLLQCRPVWAGHHGGIVMAATYSWDDQLIVSGSDLDFNIYVWDTRTGDKIKTIKGINEGRPTWCQFTPKNDRILVTSMDRTAKFYDLRSDRVTISLQDHTNVVSGASMSADERKLVTCSWDKTLQLYDISTGMYRSGGPSALAKGHEGSISCCRFNKDGSSIVSGGLDNNIIVWDVETRTNELKLQGHDDWVNDVSMSEDRQWLLSCSKDTTVRMWNIENTENLPTVVEKRISMGMKILQGDRPLLKCTLCGKPFSYSELETGNTGGAQPKCVFCRLADPTRNLTDISKHVSGLTDGYAIEEEDEEEQEEQA